MDVYAAIEGRRTIRDFSTRRIEPEIVERLLAAGLQAPSNNHMREWHFVLLQDHERREELLCQVIHPVDRSGAVQIIDEWKLTDELQREMYIEGIPRQYSMLLNAAVLIFPFFYNPWPLLQPESLSSLNAFASIWCCVENILIAAAAEGIYGVTRIPFEEERKVIRSFLKVPAGYETPCYIALGYPAENAFRARQVPVTVAERIHSDAW